MLMISRQSSIWYNIILSQGIRDHHDRDRMVVGFTPTYAISNYHDWCLSSNPVHDEVYSIQHYVIKFVTDLRQVCSFLRVFRFSPPIKLTALITETLLKVALNTINQTIIISQGILLYTLCAIYNVYASSILRIYL